MILLSRLVAKQPVVSKSVDTPQCLQSPSTYHGISQITTASKNKNHNLKRQFKFEHPTALPAIKANKLSTGSNMNITSHFAKVKHQRTITAKNSEKSTMKRQTKIQEFSSLVTETKKLTKSCISMETISDEEREFLRREILSASNVACTLVFGDGRTLLRTYSKKQLVRRKASLHKAIFSSATSDANLGEKEIPGSENFRYMQVVV